MSRRATADYPLVLIALLLTAFGIAMVYSAGQTDVPTVVRGAWIRQLQWLGVGVVAFLVVTRLSVRFLEWVTVPAYVVTCLLLVVTKLFGSGAGTAASMNGWLTIGGVRLGQPSELAKLAVALMLARVLASYRTTPRNLMELVKPAAIVFIPWVLVMLQPDLGTGLVFIGMFFVMLFWAGISGPLLLLAASPVISLVLAGSTGLWAAWFLILLVVVWWHKPYVVEGVVLVLANVMMGVAAPILWDKLKPSQQNRLLVFLDPSRDPKGSSYHIAQSRIAIGSGGGRGRASPRGRRSGSRSCRSSTRTSSGPSSARNSGSSA